MNHLRRAIILLFIFVTVNCVDSSTKLQSNELSDKLTNQKSELSKTKISKTKTPKTKPSKISLTPFEKKIAQRIMVSIRYFCEEALPEDKNCKQPVTQLPRTLAELIKETELGGVVLFSENLESNHQIIQLTNDLQYAASLSQSGKPLLIGIDQEGGRVVRLKRSDTSAFSGNMAIGATYPEHGTYYATQVGNAIGEELYALGINLNFSPVVDVNSNPDNPVINVRSFGENTEMVSSLGIAMMDALQKQNVIATLKHFPGHGNTNIDSHTGLPRVDSDRQSVYKTDLQPFKKAIELSNPGMIMTAHIEYPHLDDSRLKSNLGEEIIKPATMSEKILTGLLREEMGFKGIIITDALNMASIDHHFDLDEATAISLMAGADIALMPFRISRIEDIEGFKLFIKNVASKMLDSQSESLKMESSLKRINKIKSDYQIGNKNNNNLVKTNRIKEQSDGLAGIKRHKKLQEKLAFDSITLLKNNKQALPLNDQSISHIHVILQDPNQQELVDIELNEIWQKSFSKPLKLTSSLLTDFDQQKNNQSILAADALLLFYSEKRESAVVKGEVDDLLLNINPISADKVKQQELIRKKLIYSSLKLAKQNNKPVIVLAMQSPYEMRQFTELADTILIAYDPSIYREKETGQLVGETYTAAISALFNLNYAKGRLPVSLD